MRPCLITPCNHKLLGEGPMQEVTTQKHDYVPKYVGKSKPFKHPVNLVSSDCPLEETTVNKMSYQPVDRPERARPFYPRHEFEMPKGRFTGTTPFFRYPDTKNWAFLQVKRCTPCRTNRWRYLLQKTSRGRGRTGTNHPSWRWRETLSNRWASSRLECSWNVLQTILRPYHAHQEPSCLQYLSSRITLETKLLVPPLAFVVPVPRPHASLSFVLNAIF